MGVLVLGLLGRYTHQEEIYPEIETNNKCSQKLKTLIYKNIYGKVK